MRYVHLASLLAILLLGCGTPRPAIQPTPDASADPNAELTTLQKAFREAIPIRSGAGPRISVFPGRVPRVNLGGTELLVVPAVVDPSQAYTLVVSSYVTRAPDGSNMLFYPVISVVDDTFQIQQTLKPKYEFAFDGDRLLNEFAVPPGAKRLLIHTDQQYFRGSFVGATTTGNLSGAAYGVAGAVGGVVGALFLHAASTGSSKEFRFGELGVIDIKSK